MQFPQIWSIPVKKEILRDYCKRHDKKKLQLIESKKKIQVKHVA